MANKTVTVLLKAITGAYRAEMTKSAAATQALAMAGGQAGTATQMLTRVLGPTGLAAAKVAAAFGAAGGVTAVLLGSAKAAIDFESNFAGVRKTVDATEPQLQAIAMGFRQMSTEIPASTAELSKVGEAAGQLGIRKEHILGFTETMIHLGNTTNLSADEAATALARLANITQMPQDEFDNLGSTLVHLGNNFATTEAEIADMSLRIAGAGNAIGLTEAEILSFATALSSVGIKAEKGGSAIGRVFFKIQEAAEAGGEQLETFATVAGVSADEFARTFSTKPAEAVTLFIEGLGRLQEQGDLTAATFEALGLSEIRVRDTLLVTAGAADLTRRALQTGNEAWAQNTALIEEAEKRYETTASRIEIAKNSVVNLAIEMGNSLLPAIGATADALTDLLQGVGGTPPPEDAPMSEQFWQVLGQSIRMMIPGLENFGKANAEAARQQALMDSGIGDYVHTLTLLDEKNRAAIESTGAYTGQANLAGVSIGEVDKQTRLATYSTEQLAAQSVDAARFAMSHAEATEQEKIELALYGDTATEVGAEVEGLTEKQEDLQKSIQETFSGLGAYEAALDKKTEKERAAAEKTAESTKNATDSWEDHFKEVQVTGTDLIKELERQIKSYENWEDNLRTIAKRGRADVAAELAAMGPEGAELAEIFANMTDKEFKRAARLWYQVHEKAGDDNVRSLEASLAREAVIADEGTGEVTSNMTQRLTGGVERAARIIDGYAGSLKEGLNPIIASVGGKKVTLSATAAQAYVRNKYRAEGGIDERDRSSAHMVSGLSVLYGEPETGGEAYIPLSPAKRPRSRMIATETVKRLGGNVEWMATGGFKSVKDIPKVPNLDPGEIGYMGERAMQHTREAVVKWVKENLAPELGSGVGWKKMWAALSRRFPNARLHSAFRPGAITATGNRSYHGMGRAIDVSPWHSIAQWIRDNYMRQTREMIFSPFGSRQIHNGGNHYYSGITRAMHWDHVHWAMAQGGLVDSMAKGGTRGGRWKPPRGYNAYIKRLIRRVSGGKSLFEDFSFPGMGKFGRKYNDAVAARFYRHHPNFDFGPGGSRNQRATLLRALRSYLMADGGLFDPKVLGREIGKQVAPMLGAPPSADADHDKLGMRVQSYDHGGFLPQGLSMAYNGTGAPEPVGHGAGVGAQIMVIVPGLNQTFLGEVRQMNVAQARMASHRGRAGA